jgi:DNA polymerase-3 subunit beta
MKFRISRYIFKESLSKIQAVATSSKTMAILANCLIEVQGDILFITATDLEVGMRSSFPCNGIEDGSLTVSAKKIYEIVKEMPDEDIIFTSTANSWAEVTCGKAKFKIVGLPAEDFPVLPSHDGPFVSLGCSSLKSMIERTNYCICTDETKYALSGAFLKAADGDLHMVATDGHRLAYSKQAFEGMLADHLVKGVIIPKKGIAEMKKIAEDSSAEETMQLGFSGNNLIVKKSTTTVTMRLVDGDFPDYTKVIPVGNDHSVVVDKGIFLGTLKRTQVLSSDKNNGCLVKIGSNLMSIESNNPELGECREQFDAAYDGQVISIRLNPRFMTDVAMTIPGEIEMLIKDETSPIIMKPAKNNDYLAVIMPMRL